ncbi:hypothetical protein ACFVHS_07435 [Streptomyces sp. NPDC057746]|uniref:hypothetical protein n=1 Tax=Streptomyces sp. NPDC057746 TaxID=3346237 RepID=UPI0036C050E2
MGDGAGEHGQQETAPPQRQRHEPDCPSGTGTALAGIAAALMIAGCAGPALFTAHHIADQTRRAGGDAACCRWRTYGRL